METTTTEHTDEPNCCLACFEKMNASVAHFHRWGNVLAAEPSKLRKYDNDREDYFAL